MSAVVVLCKHREVIECCYLHQEFFDLCLYGFDGLTGESPAVRPVASQWLDRRVSGSQTDGSFKWQLQISVV